MTESAHFPDSVLPDGVPRPGDMTEHEDSMPESRSRTTIACRNMTVARALWRATGADRGAVRDLTRLD